MAVTQVERRKRPRHQKLGACPNNSSSRPNGFSLAEPVAGKKVAYDKPKHKGMNGNIFNNFRISYLSTPGL
jgi:hypothetical protein